MSRAAPLAAALLLFACSKEKAAPQRCVPGSVIACPCRGTPTGTQTCNAAGAFEACLCPVCEPGAIASCSCDGAPGEAPCGGNGQPGACVCGAPTDGKRDGGVDAAGDAPVGDAPSADVYPSGLVVIELEAAHLVSDPAKGRLYATVSGKDEAHGNTLAVIDVETGKVMSSVPVGSNPNQIGIGADAATVWVGIDTASSLAKVDVSGPTPVLGPVTKLPTWKGDPTTAQSFYVVPGTSNTIVASLARTTRGGADQAVLMMLDDGVPRPTNVPMDYAGNYVAPGPGSWGFAYNQYGEVNVFYTLTLGADGLTETRTTVLLKNATLSYAPRDTRVYGSTGVAVDVSDPSKPVRTGTFPFTGPVWVPASGSDVFIVSSRDGMTGAPVTVRRFDKDSFTAKASITAPSLGESYVFDLVDAGSGRLAFIYDKWTGPGEGARVRGVAVVAAP